MYIREAKTIFSTHKKKIDGEQVTVFGIFVFACGVVFYMIGVQIYDSEET